jgi:hypothetical protein
MHDVDKLSVSLVLLQPEERSIHVNLDFVRSLQEGGR